MNFKYLFTELSYIDQNLYTSQTIDELFKNGSKNRFCYHGNNVSLSNSGKPCCYGPKLTTNSMQMSIYDFK